MRLRVLGSSSKGNCYILIAGDGTLIIEAGVKLQEIKKTLGFKLSNIAGCLISHQHNDHAGYIREYADRGITVLTSKEVIKAKGLEGHNRVKPVYPEHGYKVGSFKVIPFEVSHDVYCLGFLIHHQESGNIMFITDTYTCEYTFEGLNQIIIECNYADDILEDKIINKGLNGIIRPRLMYSHMELGNCKHIIRSQDISSVLNIVLIHLSDGNSDEKRFVTEIHSEFCKTVTAANKDIDIDFNINPY